MLKKGHRHNPYKKAEELLDYLQRNPRFKGAAICMTWGNGVKSSIVIGDLKGSKSDFCESIRQHESVKLESNTE